MSVEARINDASREKRCRSLKPLGDLERYSEDTLSTILYATLQASGIRSTDADHVASHIGKASGLLWLLKSPPHHVNRKGKMPYIPREVAEKHGLSADGGDGECLSEAVFEIASVASSAHLEKAGGLSPTVPSESFPAVLAQVLLGPLRRCEFNVLDSRLARGVLGRSPLWFQLKLQSYTWRNKY